MLVWLEILALATAVGVQTRSWLAVLATLVGLRLLLRGPAGVVLGLGLSAAWGAFGFVAGRGTSEPLLGWLLGPLFFAVALGVHRESFGWARRRLARWGRVEPAVGGLPLSAAFSEGSPESMRSGPFHDGDVIDVAFWDA